MSQQKAPALKRAFSHTQETQANGHEDKSLKQSEDRGVEYNISGNNLTIIKIPRALDVRLFLWNLLRTNLHVTKITFEAETIGRENATSFIKFLASNQQVTHLSFHGNDMSCLKVDFLARALLNYNQVITHLELTSCNIGDSQANILG